MIARQLDAVIIPLSPVVDMSWLTALTAYAYMRSEMDAAPDAVSRMNAIFRAKRLYPELEPHDVNVTPRPTWGAAPTRGMGRRAYRGWKLSQG